MYVLLYVNRDNHPSYIQGSIEQINEQLITIWADGAVDTYDWDCGPWQLLGMEDGQLTPMANVTCTLVPHFEVN